MLPDLALILGVILLTVSVVLNVVAYFVGRAMAHEIDRRNEELDQADRHLVETQNRLYAAWKDGALIPPAKEDVAPELLEPLPEPLSVVLREYDDPRARDQWDRYFRQELAKGLAPDAILLSMEREEEPA